MTNTYEDMIRGKGVRAIDVGISAPDAPEATAAPTPYMPPGATSDPATSTAFAPVEAQGQYMQDVYGTSADATAENFAYYGAMKAGMEQGEAAGEAEYQRTLSAFTPSKLAVERAQRISAYRNVQMGIIPQIAQHVEDFGLEAAPSLGITLGAGAVGATPGALAGLAGGPFAGVTVPAGAGAGFLVGSASAAAMMGSGEIYKALRQRGLTHAQATPWALGGGMLEAALMTFRIKGLPGVMGQAYDAMKEATSLAPALVQFAARFTKDLGVNATLAALQTTAGLMAEYQGAVVNNKKMPELADYVQHTVIPAAMASGLQGATLAGSFHIGGIGLAATMRAMGRIVATAKGKVIPIGTSIDVAASQAHVDNLWDQATDLESVYKGINNTVDKLMQEGKPVPPQLLQASFEALDALGKAQAKAKAAAEAHQAKVAFDALSDDERKKAATKELDQAEGALLHVQHKIDSLVDPKKPTPELKAELKQAYIDKRIAVENKRKVELEIEREKLEEKATSNEATPAVVRAKNAITAIDKELKDIKRAAVKRQSVKRITELQADIDNVETEIADRNKAVQDETKAAVDKINIQRKAFSRPLLKAIEKMDMETEIRKKHPTTKLKERLDKLKDQLDYLKLLVDLIDSDSLTPEEIKALNVKIHSGGVETLVSTARRLITRVARETAKDVTRNIKDDFKLVESFTRHLGLTKEEQSKLKQFQPGSNLAEHMDYLEGRAKELVDKREKADANEALTKALKETQPDRVNKTLRGLPVVQSILSLYHQLITDLRDEKKLNKILTDIFTTDITNEDIAKEPENGELHILVIRQIAEEILDALGDTGSPEKVQALAEHMEAIAKKGLELKHELAALIMAEREAAIQTALNGLPEDKRGFESGKVNRIEREARVGGNVISTWNIMVDIMFQFADDATKAKLRKLFSVRKASDATRANINERVERMFDLVTGTDEKLQRLLIEGSVPEDRDNAPHLSLKLTSANQLTQLYAWMLDPSLQPRLVKGNGFTLKGENSTMAWVKNEIGPKRVEMVHKLQAFYKEMYAIANEAHMRRFNFPLAENPHYGGMALAILEDTTTNDFLKAATERKSFIPGILKDKVENITPLPLDVDVFDNAKGYVRMLTHFDEWTKTEGESKLGTGDKLQLLKDRRIQERLVHLFGKQTVDMINQAIDDISGVRPVVVKDLPIIKELNKTVGSVIHSAVQIYKQFTGILNYMSYESDLTLWYGAGEVLLNFEKYHAIFKEMDFIKAREQGAFADLEARINSVRDDWFGFKPKLSADNKVAAGLRIAQHIQSFPINIADLANIYLGGGALYIAELARGEAAGLSPEAAHERAEAYMAKSSVESQGSSLPDQRTPMERDPLGSALAKFSKPAVQAHLIGINAVRQFLAKPSMKGLHEVLATGIAIRAAEIGFVTAGAALPLFTAFMTLQNHNDKQHKKEFDDKLKNFQMSLFLASTLGPLTGVPTVGNVVLMGLYKTVINAFQAGKAHQYEVQIPILEMASQFAIWGAFEASHLVPGHQHWTMEQSFSAWRTFNRSAVMAVTGLNIQPAFDATLAIIHYNETTGQLNARKHHDANITRIDKSKAGHHQ